MDTRSLMAAFSGFVPILSVFVLAASGSVPGIRGFALTL